MTLFRKPNTHWVGIWAATAGAAVVAAASLLATTGASHQEQPIAEVRAAANKIVAADLKRHVDYLASDALLGRATPSPGQDSAAAYVIRELQQLGLEPFGDNGTWKQGYTITRTFLDTIATSAILHGRRLQYARDFALSNFLRRGEFVGEVVYVGHGIRSARLNLDPYAGLDIRGKWLLVHHTNALPTGVSRAMLGENGVDYLTALHAGRSRGAAGVLVVPFGAALANIDDVRPKPLSSRDLNPSVGWAYASDPLPRLTLSRESLSLLLADERVSADQVLAADANGSYPTSFALTPGKRFSLTVAGTDSSVHAYNVVGFVRGSHSVYGEQYISVGAHLDGSVGRGVVNGDSIFNAADDNASGSAGLLAVAKAFTGGPRPRRSVLFVWDTGEETGLLGSRHLAYGPMSQKIVVHMNVDMIGRSKVPGTNNPGEEDLAGPGEVFLSGPGELSNGIDAIVRRVEREFPYTTLNRKFDVATESFFYPRTDAAPYFEQGIPFVQFFTGLHADYHRPADGPDRLDISQMERISRTVYSVLWFLADDQRRLYMDKPLHPRLAAILDRQAR